VDVRDSDGPTKVKGFLIDGARLLLRQLGLSYIAARGLVLDFEGFVFYYVLLSGGVF
jgi:hypothetical protein